MARFTDASARTLGRFKVAMAILVALLSLAVPASAQEGAEGEILALMERWAELYSTSTAPEGIVALYADDAVFWGTGSREPFLGAATFAPYFQTQFTNFPQRMVSFYDPVVRLYGDEQFATNTGTYEFQVRTLDGQEMQVRHRYSFAYAKLDGTWKIVHQHSSAMPPQ